MNFRVLRGIRPILVSLSIVASSSQVESAKIDVNFIADVLDKFAKYREGEFDAAEAFNEDFGYLDKEVFNSGLYHDFRKDMSEFNQYLAVHTLRKFFDCNEPIKKSFKFVHKNIKELVFLLHDFKGSDAFGYRILEALKNCGLKKSRFTSKTFDMKMTQEESKGISSYFKYSNVLGLMSKGWHEDICRTGLCGTGADLEDLIREKMRNHLGKDKFEKLEKRVGSNRLYGILSFMLATIHEITHHVGRYLGALERLCGVAESDNPINMLSGIEYDDSTFFMAYFEDIKTMGELFEASGAKGRIDEVKAYRKSLKNKFNSKLSLEDLVQELGKKADERKAKYRYFGHSEYAAEMATEDIPDSIALSMLPCCVDLAGPEALRECLNAYADKLLSFCK